jgi:glycosyltransferase involved in cell wall biosynthesis
MFIPATDGSGKIYESWLAALLGMGHQVSLLSFNQARVRWTAESLRQLEDAQIACCILEAYPKGLAGITIRGASLLQRLLFGKRFLPALLEDRLRGLQRVAAASFLNRGAFDTIIVNKLHTVPMVGAARLRESGARLLLDIHDNYPERELQTRRLLLSGDGAQIGHTVSLTEAVNALAIWSKVQRLIEEEIRGMSLFDFVLFSSPIEREAYVVRGLPRDRAVCVAWPLVSNCELAHEVRTRSFALGFIGGNTLFNFESCRFLARDVLPKLKDRVQRVPILIAGGIAKTATVLFKREDAVTFKPWLADLDDFYGQVEIVVVPLLSGTGVSVKTMEAASYGAAIVSTEVGCRGLRLIDGRDLRVAHTAGEFAAAILDLLANPMEIKRLRVSARRGIDRFHSMHAFRESIAGIL